MPEILYTSSAVRNTIAKIFESPRNRRVAIVAFVGEDAEAYLPNPEGLELICWPKAGGTNPNVLRRLKKRGAKIYFADSLHMKVYWAKGIGAVITSANLSSNALGSGNLREVGIQLSSDSVDIDRLIASIRPHRASDAELLKLDQQHKLFVSRNPGFRSKFKQNTWKDWYTSEARPKWKIGWWDAEESVSKAAKKKSKNQYGESDPHDFIDGQNGDFTQGDCVLTFQLGGESPTRLRWLNINFTIRVPKSERKANDTLYPFQAIQVHSPKAYPAPPFCIDKQFRSAFRKAIQTFGADAVKNWTSTKPSKRLIEEIQKNMLMT